MLTGSRLSTILIIVIFHVKTFQLRKYEDRLLLKKIISISECICITVVVWTVVWTKHSFVKVKVLWAINNRDISIVFYKPNNHLVVRD